MHRKWTCHSAASLHKVHDKRKQTSQSSRGKNLCNHLEQIDWCLQEGPSGILQELLNQPPVKLVQQKPRLNLKVDVEGLKQERHKLKRENVQLQKQLDLSKLQCVGLQGEIKRLREFEQYFESTANDELRDAPGYCGKPSKHDTLVLLNQRKQINVLKAAALEKDTEIGRLRRIPANNTIMELQAERQQLVEQTIRLKAVIRSIAQPANAELEMVDEMLKLLKEQNQKLKGSLRLCEHEKSLVRAKKSIIKKEKEALAREVAQLKSRLADKTNEMDLLAHENKNLLLKRITQFKLMQEQKDREEIERLSSQIDSLNAAKHSLENSNTALREQLEQLKEKHKTAVQNESRLQENHDAAVKNFQEQLEQSQEELKNFKENYLKSQSVSESSTMNRWSMNTRTFMNRTNQTTKEPESSLRKKLTRPVRVGELRSEILHLKVCMIKHQLRWQQLLVKDFSQRELYRLFADGPFNFPMVSASKLVRYLCEDSEQVAGGDRVQSKELLVRILSTIVPHCQLIQQRRQTMLEEWFQVHSYPMQTIRLYGERLIRSISDLARKQKYSRFEELSHILRELGIRKSQEELDLLASEICNDTFEEQGRFEVASLLAFLQRSQRQQGPSQQF